MRIVPDFNLKDDYLTPEGTIGSETGFDLLDLLIFVLRAKRLILVTTVLSGLLGVGVALSLPEEFTATAVIMPPQQDQSSGMAALAGQLGSLSTLGPGTGFGLKNPADMYVGILQGEVISRDLISRFSLQRVYKARLQVDARTQLRQHSSFEAAKDGLIYIQVRDHDPARSASLANAYVDSLYSLLSRLAVIQATQRRLFYEGQLDEERSALANAEDTLKRTEEKTGLIQLSGQAEQMIHTIASTKAQIASREVELGVARTFATAQNPDVADLQQQIVGLKAQLSILENAQTHTQQGDVQVSSGKVPEVGLDYTRRLRDVRYHESLLELLLKQREAASLDEARSAPQIEVIAPAEVPERKSGPSRSLIIVGTLFAGLAMSSTWAVLVGVAASLLRRPGQAARFSALRTASGLSHETREDAPSTLGESSC